MDRVSVAEAARRLGVSQDAVYKRIKRGTIRWEKGADEKTYVWIEELDESTDSSGTSTDQSYDASTDQSYDASTDHSTDPLLGELRDRIRFLEAELEDRKEEARRKDAILMTMAQRIPELEAPREYPESPETASEEPYSTHAPSEPQEPSQRRSWWRAFFGLD
jgi:hypothetical protein